jgi:hypothetical protein
MTPDELLEKLYEAGYVLAARKDGVLIQLPLVEIDDILDRLIGGS